MDNMNERLKYSIKNSKYNQKQIAEIIKTSQNTLSSYMTGKAAITVEMLSKICELLNVSIEWVVYGKEKEQLNEREKELINNYRQLPEKEKIKIEGIIEFVLDEFKGKSCTSKDTEKEKSKKIDTA